MYGILDIAQSATGIVGPILGGSLSRVGVGGSDGVSAPLGTVVGLYGVVLLMATFGYERLILGTDSVSGFEGGKTIDVSITTVEVGKKNTYISEQDNVISTVEIEGECLVNGR